MTKTEQARLWAWRCKVLREASSEARNVARTCRHFGISRQAFYRWKRRFEATGEAGLWKQLVEGVDSECARVVKPTR